VPAVATHYKRGRAAPVHKQDCLFTRGERPIQRLLQRPAENAGISRAQLIAQVYDVNRGQVGIERVRILTGERPVFCYRMGQA